MTIKSSSSSSISQDVVVISDGISDNNKIDDKTKNNINDGGEMNDSLWLRINNVVLKSLLLLGGDELNDKIINAALINQFPSLQGLRSTVVQRYLGFCKEKYLQIIHCGLLTGSQ